MKVYSTIIRSVVTEKSSQAQEKNKYTFLVAKEATKTEVKKAIKAIFGVDVDTVRTIITPKKKRIVKGKYELIKRPNYKKALVTLKDNKTIDPNKIEFPKKTKE